MARNRVVEMSDQGRFCEAFWREEALETYDNGGICTPRQCSKPQFSPRLGERDHAGKKRGNI
jgi:hypothetical protein